MNKVQKISYIIAFVVFAVACDNSDKGIENSMVKPEITTFRFASSNTDCGAYTQNRTGAMIHINTEKCHNEVYRPTLTLQFGTNNPIAPGTYTINETSETGQGEVYISSTDYMNPNLQPQLFWVAVKGSIEIVTNDTDATKLDVEFKSIEMHNTSFESNMAIPEYDTLTGYIIGI